MWTPGLEEKKTYCVSEMVQAGHRTATRVRVLGGQPLLLPGLLSNLKEDVRLYVNCAEWEHSDALAVGRRILEEIHGPYLALKQVQFYIGDGRVVVVHRFDLFEGRALRHQRVSSAPQRCKCGPRKDHVLLESRSLPSHKSWGRRRRSAARPHTKSAQTSFVKVRLLRAKGTVFNAIPRGMICKPTWRTWCLFSLTCSLLFHDGLELQPVLKNFVVELRESGQLHGESDAAWEVRLKTLNVATRNQI